MKRQTGELTGGFNELAASLEQFQKQEAARLGFESDHRIARRFKRTRFVIGGQSCLGPLSPAIQARNNLESSVRMGVGEKLQPPADG